MENALDVLTSVVFVACTDQEPQVSTLFFRALSECLLIPVDRFLRKQTHISGKDNAEEATRSHCILVKGTNRHSSRTLCYYGGYPCTHYPAT